MAGNNYFLLPKLIFINNETKELIKDLIDEIENNIYFNLNKKQTNTLSDIKRVSEDEKEIIFEFGNLKDLVTFNFIFFERQKGSPTIHRITLFIEDIFPSRISKIFKAKEDVENNDIFKISISKNKSIEFRFDVLKKFIPSEKLLFEVIDKTFRGIKIDINLLFTWFMNYIRSNFIKGIILEAIVLEAFISLLFFNKLGF